MSQIRSEERTREFVLIKKCCKYLLLLGLGLLGLLGLLGVSVVSIHT